MGRRNWLFCWSEVGAKYVGIIQSLIVTCILQEINPNIYLTDILQRVKTHPADAMIELTPRVFGNRNLLTIRYCQIWRIYRCVLTCPVTLRLLG